MLKKDITIATITWARNAQEQAVLQEALQQLAALDIPVFITDGGSGENFLKFIRSFPDFTLLGPVQGLWMQTKTSLLAAFHTGFPFVFYTEPDKKDFFSDILPDLLTKIRTDADTGIVLASRSLRGFQTFPVFQQMTETTINNCCAEITGRKTDYVYGPFLMNRNIIPFLEELPPTIGWGWRPYAFNISRHLGYRTDVVEGDFSCPQNQRQEDSAERLYRMKQMSQNIDGLILSAQASIVPQKL
jgi:hypothetical protein